MAYTAQTLAELSAATYEVDPAAHVPAGFAAVDLPSLGMAGGVYQNGHALALIEQGLVEGQSVLVVAIRGTDDTATWVTDIQNIDQAYADLAPLAGALERYAAAGGRVLLTGHSLGGAMDQVFMAQHLGDDHFRAVTFGSPGALAQPATFAVDFDARITNYAVSDDPFVFLGEHRAEVADYAAKNAAFALGLSAALSTVTGLAAGTVLPLLRASSADYANNGPTVTLIGPQDGLSIPGLLTADPGEHDPQTYVALSGGASVAEPPLWSPGEVLTGPAPGAVSLTGGAGGDRLSAGAGDGASSLSGGAGNDTVSASVGTNYLRGGDGDDSIVGGAGFDDINGNAGNDTCISGGGDDWVVGGKDNDSLVGSDGQNLIYGNLGNDTCEGGAGNDIVRGGQGNDVVNGGAGDDFVSGDKGDDTETGGAGADIFHTFGDAGIDRVLDFHASEGDRVMLDPGTQYTVAQEGADTVISMTGGGQMTLVGVTLSSLPAGWIFGA